MSVISSCKTGVIRRNTIRNEYIRGKVQTEQFGDKERQRWNILEWEQKDPRGKIVDLHKMRRFALTYFQTAADCKLKKSFCWCWITVEWQSINHINNLSQPRSQLEVLFELSSKKENQTWQEWLKRTNSCSGAQLCFTHPEHHRAVVVVTLWERKWLLSILPAIPKILTIEPPVVHDKVTGLLIRQLLPH